MIALKRHGTITTPLEVERRFRPPKVSPPAPGKACVVNMPCVASSVDYLTSYPTVLPPYYHLQNSIPPVGKEVPGELVVLGSFDLKTNFPRAQGNFLGSKTYV